MIQLTIMVENCSILPFFFSVWLWIKSLNFFFSFFFFFFLQFVSRVSLSLFHTQAKPVYVISGWAHDWLAVPYWICCMAEQIQLSSNKNINIQTHQFVSVLHYIKYTAITLFSMDTSWLGSLFFAHHPSYIRCSFIQQ